MVWWLTGTLPYVPQGTMGMLGPSLNVGQKVGSTQHLTTRGDPKTWHSLDLDPHNMRPPPLKTQRSSSMPTPKVKCKGRGGVLAGMGRSLPVFPSPCLPPVLQVRLFTVCSMEVLFSGTVASLSCRFPVYFPPCRRTQNRTPGSLLLLCEGLPLVITSSHPYRSLSASGCLMAP